MKTLAERMHRVGSIFVGAGLLCAVVVLASLGLAPHANAAQPVDVVFVLDNSGSMKTNDPAFLTRRAVADFARTLAEDVELDGRIGIVLFDEQARLVQALTPVTEVVSNDVLSRALAELDFSGQRTNSPAAIERALYELREHGRDSARQAIVFLSDGMIDTGDAQNDLEVARWLREDLAGESEASGIQIFGIAFTDRADYQLMQALARRTHAKYYRAYEASELAAVVKDVLATVEESPVAERAAEPSSAETSPPAVSSAPLDPTQTPNVDSGSGLIGWLPIALLLVAGAVYFRRRNLNPTRGAAHSAKRPAPPAQLLDPGGLVGEAGAALPLNAGRTTIGRDPKNDIVLEDDTISSEHAVIEVREGRYWLQNLRSTNGTRLANERLAPDESRPLKGGDHIRFADFDLMFVVGGYVPGGATVYLSSSMTPGTEGSVLADAKHPNADPVRANPDPSDRSVRKPPAEVASRNTENESMDPASSEAVFAERRARLDPASILDLDDELGVGGDARSEDAPAVVSAERETPLALLPDPEPDPELAAAPLRECLDYHLARVSEISPAFAGFVEQAFGQELRAALPVAATALLAEAQKSRRIETREYTFDRIRYLICGVPAPMESARTLFVEEYGGFTRVLAEQLRAESFHTDRCETLALLSFGHGDSPWVSLTIVPDDGQASPIELLSYEFLTEQERQEIEPALDSEISQSGLA